MASAETHHPKASARLYLNIDDDDRTTFSFSSATFTVAEGAGSVTLTVNLTGMLAVDFPGLAATTTDGTAVRGTDWQTSTGTSNVAIPFSAGESSKTVAITILEDTNVESDERLTVTLELPSETTPPISATTPRAAAVTINDNDGTSTVTLSASPNPVDGYAVVGDVQIIEREMAIAGREWTAEGCAIVDALKRWQRGRRRIEDAYRKFVRPIPSRARHTTPTATST